MQCDPVGIVSKKETKFLTLCMAFITTQCDHFIFVVTKSSTSIYYLKVFYYLNLLLQLGSPPQDVIPPFICQILNSLSVPFYGTYGSE